MQFVRYAVSAAFLFLAGCATSIDPTSDVSPSDFLVHGIDVSKYQGEIDWDTVRGSGVTFAWIKATEGGDYKDQWFDHNWDAAKSAGIRRGAYHFAYWCRSAAEQVAWFEKHVPVESDALPPVLDVEWNPTSKTCPKKLSREAALSEMRTILSEMERFYGKRPVIYSTVDFYRDVLSDNELSEYPIWVRSVKYSPRVKYGSRRWQFWQYTADGSVPGIRGGVDRNAFFGTRKQWEAFVDSPT